MKKKSIFLQIIIMSFLLNINNPLMANDDQTDHLLQELAMEIQSDILAASPSRDGLGEIEITQTEDDGIGVFVSFPIGYKVNVSRELKELPYPLQVSGLYKHITGLELPKKAFDALVNLEIAKLRAMHEQPNWLNNLAETEFDNLEEPNLLPANACADAYISKYIFKHNCKIYGGYTVVNKADDICLSTTAYKGNHVQEVAYYSVQNKKYLPNHLKTIYEGKWATYARMTAVKRYRRGRITFASSTDYSRFHIEGDELLVQVWYEYGSCYTYWG